MFNSAQKSWREQLSSRRASFILFLATYALPCASAVLAQTPSLLPVEPPKTPPTPPLHAPETAGSELPEAPGVPSRQQDIVLVAHNAFETTGDPTPQLTGYKAPVWSTKVDPGFYKRIQQRRFQILSNQRFLNDEVSIPMTSREKAYIALTDFADPGNLAVIAFSSAIYVASTPESAYGSGLAGFGRNYGYSLSQAATGETLGTWLIPSIAHQDPRYHRMPGAPLQKRILHALAHTVISQSDTGRTIPNYATLLTYPFSAAIANTYVPGLQRNVPATTQRVLIGLASDPSDALIGEFLPDVARRIHIRVTFFQRIINDYSTERQ